MYKSIVTDQQPDVPGQLSRGRNVDDLKVDDFQLFSTDFRLSLVTDLSRVPGHQLL